MKLSDLEKTWILFKFQQDIKFGSKGKTPVEDKYLSIFLDLQKKGLASTKDNITKPYPNFSLTDMAHKEAEIIYNSSSADKLVELGKLLSPDKNTKLPDSSIFMQKKVEQNKLNNSKN